MQSEVNALGIVQADVDAFCDALKLYHTKCGKSMRVAMRMGTIDLIKSLRARSGGTRVSKKRIERSDAMPSDNKPKFVTNKNRKVFRRWTTVRYNKGHKVLKDVFVPAYQKEKRSRKTGKVTGMLTDTTAQQRNVLEDYGGIRNWGIARKSWGWFMKALFNKTTEGGDNPNAVIDERMVEGGMTEKRGHAPDGSISLDTPIEIAIDIVNKLDYIEKALFPGALQRALVKARKSISEKVSRGIGEAGRVFRHNGHR